MLPRFKDIGDFLKDMKNTFRLSAEKPRYDRFSYRNKIAYWLVYAGVIVIVVTGYILMYPIGASEALGPSAYPLALIIHSDAAVLAVGWMLFVHVYFAHFARHVFPMDKGIFTGKVSVERYKEEFPLEYERILAEAGVPTTPADGLEGDEPPKGKDRRSPYP
jgi:cytochrome b subunit of formate dehydrogenase